MKRTLYAIAALALVTAVACNKGDEDPVKVPERGSIRFINTSTDLYDFYLNDVKFGDLYGDDTAVFNDIETGSHRVKAIQTGNVMGVPTERQQIVIVKKDSVATFIFP